MVAALMKRHKGKAAGLAAFLAVILIGAGYAIYRLTRPAGQAVAPTSSPANMQFTQLTTSGTADLSAISPDGKYVAYAQEGAGGQSLWLRQVATASNVQIVPPANMTYYGLTFSPDGNYLDYVVGPLRNAALPDLFSVPVLGGQSRKVLDNVNSAVTFSPDGKQIAFVRTAGESRGIAFQIVLADSDGSNQRVLATRHIPKVFPFGTMGPGASAQPAWSPDSKVIVVNAGTLYPTWQFHPIAVDVASGRELAVGPRRWFHIYQLEWMRDGKSFLMIAADFSTPWQHQIWRVTYPGGTPERITNDLNNYLGVGVTADGDTLATVETQNSSNIWIAPGGAWDRSQQVTKGLSNEDGMGGLSWATGGRIVYGSMENGTGALWLVNPKNDEPQKVTQTRFPSLDPSACGGSVGYLTFVAFLQVPTIARVDADGSNLKQLTPGQFGLDPSCSPDKKSVLYWSPSSGSPQAWEVAIDGGKPVQLTHAQEVFYPVASFDGKWIACQYKENSTKPSEIAILPFAGGKPVNTFQVPPTAGFLPLAWMPDGRAIAYLVQANGVSNIMAQPIAGGLPRQLTHYDSGHIFWFAISRDGKLALARGSKSSDVVLIRNFK